MRRFVRNQILELIPTIWAGVKQAKLSTPQVAGSLLADCYLAVQTIEKTLQNSLSLETSKRYTNLLSILKKTLEEISAGIVENKSITDVTKKFKSEIKQLRRTIFNEKEVKLEIVFLPYKYSMWDSMYSIWLEANSDPQCECYVIPIPYYDKNQDGSLAKMHYEGELFKKNNIPIIHYLDYSILDRMPDAIYLHNIYDNCNYVTTVSPEFYTNELKKHTKMLIYAPYFVSEVMYNKVEETIPFHMTPSIKNIDKIIVQSQVVANAFIASGCRSGKLAVLGSPKFDNICLMEKHEKQLPQNWKKKVDGKLVFLLNTSLSMMLLHPGEYWWIQFVKNTLSKLISNENVAVIWRPHPLLQATIHSMRPHYEADYQKLIEQVEASNNIVLDQTDDFSSAFSCSDALVTDQSSIMRLYLATGKPIYIFGYERAEIKKHRALDFSACVLESDMNLSQFVENVSSDKYYGKEKRLDAFKRSVVNADGTCGQKVHAFVKNELLNSVDVV